MEQRVLIVDDSEFMRTLLEELLEERHRVVGEATNGVEAVQRHRELDPTVVLMNVAMPIKDGLEATEEIKDESPETTVVMCTSFDQEAVMRDAVRAGADGYVTKPFQKRSLLEAVDDAASS